LKGTTPTKSKPETPDTMKIKHIRTINSTIDSEYKLAMYSDGVEYIIYGSASWLVGNKNDDTGSFLKRKYFSE